jgi:hypothetical protein
LPGANFPSKKSSAAGALHVVSASVLSDQRDATSFKSANVQLGRNQTLVANVKSSGRCTSDHAIIKPVASSSSHTLKIQPASSLPKVSEQIVSVGAMDSFVSASPSSQIESFSQPMWLKTGLIAVVEVPLHQHA